MASQIEKTIDILLKSNIKLAEAIAQCQSANVLGDGRADYTIEYAKQEYEAVLFSVQILREKLGEQKRYSQWIDIKDRLPTAEDGNSIGFILILRGRRYMESIRVEDMLDINDYQHLNITHWMPLPDAPVREV